jgi:PAS domain S-box-containing protein
MLPPHLAESALECAPDAIAIFEASGSIVFANRRLGALFGYDAHALVGSSIERLLPGCLRRWATSLEANRELQARGKDGADFPVEVRLGSLPRDARRLIVATLHDIAERKRIATELTAARESAERATQAKSRFLATASHDLRQPLQALSLLNGALRRLNVDTDSAEPLAQQEQAIIAMSRLVNALLDISKLESGAVRPQISRFRLSPLFDELRLEFSGLAANKGLGFEVEIDSPELTLRSDPSLIEQILRNLLANAIKYTHRGKVVLRCLSEPDVLRLEVADTGIGIPSEQLPRIFEEFFQCNAPRGARSGYGLGLSIVARIVDLLGLPIEVHSASGQGSTFRLRVPDGASA